MSTFRDAVRQLLDGELRCPKCGAQNIPGAKPTLEREPNGSVSCTTCGTNWTPNKEN